jgi:hypothetical protein
MSTGHCWNQSERLNGSTGRRTRHSATPSTTISKWMTLALNPGRQPPDCTPATAWNLNNTQVKWLY